MHTTTTTVRSVCKLKNWQGHARLLAVVGLLYAVFTAGEAVAQSLTRGPYLQLGTPTSIIVRWRTNVSTNSRVRYGTELGNLTSMVDRATLTTEHEVTLTGLTPNTRYYYAVGTSTQTFAGEDPTHVFRTSPPAGTVKPTRMWVLGDSGEANANASAVREVVDRGDWISGNALVFVITGSGKRTAESFDGKATAAPKLTITYQNTSGG